MKTHDLRLALRVFRKSPAFSIGIVLMLGLGIGASTAIFSVVYGVLLKPLPYPEPDRLVQVWGAFPAREIDQVSHSEANFWDLHDQNLTLATFGAWHGASFTLTGTDSPERLNGATVSVGFFQSLSPQMIAGRVFQPGEDATGAPGDLALLSHRFWMRRYGGDRAIVGNAIHLDGRPYQVVGILPPGQAWLESADVFVPFVRRAKPDRSSWEFAAIGRLKPGASIESATADLQRVAQGLAQQYPEVNRGMTSTVVSSRTWVASDALRRTLWMLLGATGLLLLIACVNATNLLLARAAAMGREAAVRTALGATFADLLRQRLTESLVFGVASAAVGTALAWGGLQILQSFDPGGIPRLAGVELNGWVLAFAIAVAGLVALVTGVVAAVRAPSGDVMTAMRQAQRGTIGDRRNDRLRGILVGVEVALSLMLLVGAGLLVRSLMVVLANDRGFATEQRLLATVSIPRSYPDGRRIDIVTTILDKLGALPNVAAVAGVSSRPLSGGSTGLGIVPAERTDVSDKNIPWATWRIVTKDYFTVMGLTLLKGRGFTEQDIIGKPWRVVVSQRLANQLWPGVDPIGKTAILWKGQGDNQAEVVGVVSNMRERGLENDPTLAVYFPAYGSLNATTLQVVMHTTGPSDQVIGELRAVVASIDKTLPISNIRTLEEIVDASVATRRFTMLLLIVFAGVALLLALAGVYGVLAYTVARRTAEIGVRLALGASPGQVTRRVFSRGMLPVLMGIVIGAAATFFLSRLMASLLFGIQPTDMTTYALAVTAVGICAAFACYWPARRALRVDPTVALRTE